MLFVATCNYYLPFTSFYFIGPRSSSIDLGAKTAGSKVSWPCWKGDLPVAWVYRLSGGHFIWIFVACRWRHVPARDQVTWSRDNLTAGITNHQHNHFRKNRKIRCSGVLHILPQLKRMFDLPMLTPLPKVLPSRSFRGSLSAQALSWVKHEVVDSADPVKVICSEISDPTTSDRSKCWLFHAVP